MVQQVRILAALPSGWVQFPIAVSGDSKSLQTLVQGGILDLEDIYTHVHMLIHAHAGTHTNTHRSFCSSQLFSPKETHRSLF